MDKRTTQVRDSNMFEYLEDIRSPEELIGGKTQRIDRREVLKLGVAGILGALMPLLPAKNGNAAGFSPWRISLHNPHTGESFSGAYRVGDKYLPESFERINYFLRDFRTREIFPMDPRVIDIISIIQRKTANRGPLEILSGYRSPKTNAMLRRASAGVAKNSFHMYGQAIDIRLPGYSTGRLRSIARGLKAGGVGYYPKSDFIHVDTGKVRSW